ncbi:MAG: hypothetical protein C4581_11190 [Nitrospiraceae bacterium]|nr:MAG: hypothetical protein C4581_11190 [Nitrospiraceae bacterium]
MKKAVRLWFVLLSAMVLISGCAGSKKVTDMTPIQELKAPEWVMKGSGAFGGEKGKVFYGVASASRMQNISLMRTAADNRARNEVAKVFQFYTASLMKDYAASTVAGDPDVSSEEQHVEQAIKTVTSMTLSGVEVVDHWQNPATQEFFALARLDLNSFKDNFDKMQTLDKKVRDYIRENADRMHEELEKEEAKKAGQ